MTKIMRVAITEVGWQTVHKFWIGRGTLTLKKVSNFSSDWKCHFAKQTGQNIDHGVLTPTNVKRSDGADVLNIDMQCKDPNELFRN
jgi:hypothetical protein